MHARVVVYMYLIFVMTGQNISNDSDKGVQICISRMLSGNKSLVIHHCWMHVSDTDGHIDGRNTLVVNWRARQKENESIVDRHTD